MTYRRRSVTLAATLLGLVAAAAAFSAPAFARHSTMQVSSSCDRVLEKLRVDYTVQASEPGHAGTADLSYTVDGSKPQLLPEGVFTPQRDTVSDYFLLPINRSQDKTLTLTAVTHWQDRDDATNSVTVRLAHCRNTHATTTTAPVSSVPRTSIVTVTSTQALPFTGSNSGPLLLAAVSLLGAGTATLVASRSRRPRRL